MTRTLDQAFIEVGFDMLDHFEDPKRWASRISPLPAYAEDRESLQSAIRRFSVTRGLTYFQRKEMTNEFDDVLCLLKYGFDTTAFNFAQGTTIQMVRIVINAVIARAQERIVDPHAVTAQRIGTLRGRSARREDVPYRPAPPAYQSRRAALPPPAPPAPIPIVESIYVDDEFTAILVPATPETPVPSHLLRRP